MRAYKDKKVPHVLTIKTLYEGKHMQKDHQSLALTKPLSDIPYMQNSQHFH